MYNENRKITARVSGVTKIRNGTKNLVKLLTMIVGCVILEMKGDVTI